MVGERLKRNFDREPIWRRLEEKVSNPGHNIRDQIDRKTSFVPRFRKRNFGGGVGAGAVTAGVITILEDVIGVPFGGSVDTIDVEPAEDGTIYTVNVNAPTESSAKVRAFIDAGTGFTSLLTDTLDTRDVEVIGTRTFRDTYQVQIKISD